MLISLTDVFTSNAAQRVTAPSLPIPPSEKKKKKKRKHQKSLLKCLKDVMIFVLYSSMQCVEVLCWLSMHHSMHLLLLHQSQNLFPDEFVNLFWCVFLELLTIYFQFLKCCVDLKHLTQCIDSFDFHLVFYSIKTNDWFVHKSCFSITDEWSKVHLMLCWP